MEAKDPWCVGARVRIFGLKKAARHNGKIGNLAKRARPDGRIGVKLAEGQVLAVRRVNLELVVTKDKAANQKKNTLPGQRTLIRNPTVLHEFDGSRDPACLVLYYHFKDSAFDAFNTLEYHSQMLRYYAAGMSVVGVLPRKMRDNEYFLVCLQHKVTEKNSLCNLAFQCMRQFAGISMLVKKVCFVCHKPGAAECACQCACFCSEECEKRGETMHRRLCKLAKASTSDIISQV